MCCPNKRTAWYCYRGTRVEILDHFHICSALREMLGLQLDVELLGEWDAVISPMHIALAVNTRNHKKRSSMTSPNNIMVLMAAPLPVWKSVPFCREKNGTVMITKIMPIYDNFSLQGPYWLLGRDLQCRLRYRPSRISSTSPLR